MAACPEALDDGGDWSFYLFNDNAFAFEGGVLQTVGTEWGDHSHRTRVDAPIPRIEPGGFARIWREGDNVEFRMDLSLVVQTRGRQLAVTFEFPKLYAQRQLGLIGALKMRGFEVEVTTLDSPPDSK
jgi:hypothetical protein